MSSVDVEAAGRAVAETIRAERAAARLSQAEVAERASMSRITYIRYERGERQPSLAQTIQIADALGVPFGEFVRRVEGRIRAARAPESRNEPNPEPDLPDLSSGRYTLAARRMSSRGKALWAELAAAGEESQESEG